MNEIKPVYFMPAAFLSQDFPSDTSQCIAALNNVFSQIEFPLLPLFERFSGLNSLFESGVNGPRNDPLER